MRKRIIIGLLAVVVIGVLAYVVSQPRKGTLEWHKREYFALVDRIYERRPVDRARKWIESTTGLKLQRNRGRKQQQLWDRVYVHRLALIELGYTERRFLVFRPDAPWVRIHSGYLSGIDSRHRASITCQAHLVDNEIVVRGPLDDIRVFEDMIRKLDIPNWGELLVPTIGVTNVPK